MTGAELLAALRSASTDAEVLAALTEAVQIGAEAPTPEVLAEWWPTCPDTERAGATDRLRALAVHAEAVAVARGVNPGTWTDPGDGTAPPTDPRRPWSAGARWSRPWSGMMVGDAEASRAPVACLPVEVLFNDVPYLFPGAFGAAGLSRYWLVARDSGFDGPHPLTPLVAAWLDRPRSLGRRHLVAAQERHSPKGREPLTMTRQPGVLSLVSHAPLEAVAVDGEAFATRTIGGVETKMRRYQLAESQGNLFPGPRKLAGQTTAGAIFEAVAFMVLAGDERSPLRADLLRLANLAFALTGQAKLTEAEGALLVAGADTEPNRQRFNNALWALRGLGVQVRSGIWYRMATADPDLGNVIGPATWWTAAMAGRLTNAPAAWRFTGCLFVPASKWGAVERTVSGLESALLWGSSPGRGRRGRNPDNVQPVRRGGPGPEVFVPWWQVLRLSGENVEADTDPRGTEGRRYRRRCEDLTSGGYFTARNGTASAGGTVEVVEQQRGSRAHPAGLIVRASARFCAAYGNKDRVNIPASRLLTAGG